MKSSTKITIAASAILLATASWAAPTNVHAITYASTKILGPTGSANACDPLQDSIRVGVSANVVANVACSTGNVGIATANFKGRGRVYTVHSAGSIVAEASAGSGPGGKYSSEADAVGIVATRATNIVNIADSSASN